MKPRINLGLIGASFIGRVHSHAYHVAPLHFRLQRLPRLLVACDLMKARTGQIKASYGWEEDTRNWEEVVSREDVELVDVCTSTASHMPIVTAAAKNGKHVICEKPLALSIAEAKSMLDAVRAARVKHMVCFNYRRLPALQLARQLIQDGRIGEVRHVSMHYMQDQLVSDEAFYDWRNDASQGSGVNGDMNGHTIDLARFLFGEIVSVCAVEKIFTKERPVFGYKDRVSEVTAPDACLFLAKFASGALGSFVASRICPGRKNSLRIELYGTDGSLTFDAERLNELRFFSGKEPLREQGFRTILATEGEHPYMRNWWPPGHMMGWEHCFVNQMADFLSSIDSDTEVVPNFVDGLRVQEVVEAVSISAQQARWVRIQQVDDPT